MESDASGGAASATTSEAVFAVEGIHCASCVQLIEMQVGGVRGVRSLTAPDAAMPLGADEVAGSTATGTGPAAGAWRGVPGTI